MYQGGKTNFGAWMCVEKAILDNFNEQDLIVVYEYLNSIETKSMSIYKAIKAAKVYNQNQKVSIAKQEVDKLEVQQYKDFTLGDLL